MFLETTEGRQRESSELEKKSAFKFSGLLLLQLELTCLDLNANILFWYDFQFINQQYILLFQYLFSTFCVTLWRLDLKWWLFLLSRSLQIRMGWLCMRSWGRRWLLTTFTEQLLGVRHQSKFLTCTDSPTLQQLYEIGDIFIIILPIKKQRHNVFGNLPKVRYLVSGKIKPQTQAN